MDMNMAMSTIAAASATAMASMAPMTPMSGMATSFSTTTSVTLLFTEWKTSTPAAYVFTISFLFALGILNRFLGALKSQLEMRWKEGQQHEVVQPVHSHAHTGHERRSSLAASGHNRRWSRTLKPAPPRLDEEEQETEPLSPAPVEATQTDEKVASGIGKKRGLWRPSAPLSVKRDGIRAVLEFFRALIGYILMLAVMTYNVGFFFAVTGSVLLGEFVFGRYMQSGNKGWQEGGCHE